MIWSSKGLRKSPPFKDDKLSDDNGSVWTLTLGQQENHSLYNGSIERLS